jgi:hypothetical protein
VQSGKLLKLGVIGMSEGNGHPYSWSAIFNGFNGEYMNDCPFPVIPAYLSKQKFPENFLTNVGQVTHVWTQDSITSQHIAKSAKIEYVVDKMEDMIGQVDAVLLARDDPENHYEMSLPFLKAGIHLFIDKPLAVSVATAKKIIDTQAFPDQLFTCSSLKFAKEFQPDQVAKDQVGTIRFVEAYVPKSWEKYAVHIIEPVLNLLPNRGGLKKIFNSGEGQINLVTVKWENVIANFNVLGALPTGLQIDIYGDKGNQRLKFEDTFFAFKTSLAYFCSLIRKEVKNISREQTLEIVEIIEKGLVYGK